MKYILLYMVFTISGATSGSFVLEDKTICDAAREVIIAEIKTRAGYTVHAWCIPEGVKR